MFIEGARPSNFFRKEAAMTEHFVPCGDDKRQSRSYETYRRSAAMIQLRSFRATLSTTGVWRIDLGRTTYARKNQQCNQHQHWFRHVHSCIVFRKFEEGFWNDQAAAV